MQRNAGHSGSSAITLVSTSRTNGASRRLTARERRNTMMPMPGGELIAKLWAISQAAEPQFEVESAALTVNQARRPAPLAVTSSRPALNKPGAGGAAATQARTSTKAVSHD